MKSQKDTFRIAVRSFGPFESAIQKQWELFAWETGTSLSLEAVPFDLHPLRETLFKFQGLLNGEWDAAFISTDWIAEAADSEALADVAGWLKTDPPEGYPHAWPDSLLRMQDIGRRILGLPYHDGPECLIYRTDLLTEGSLPATWEEFRVAARRLHAPSKGLYGTAFAAFPDGHNTVYDFCLQLWSRGGELFTPGGNIQLNTSQAEEALNFYRAMINDTAAVHPECRSFDSVKSGLAFAAGEIAMMVNWFGFAAMSETVPESRVKGKVGIARIPCQGGPPTSLNAYWILGIGSGCTHKEAAWQFLKYCASAPMDLLLTKEGGIGCRRTSWSHPEVNAAIPFYNKLEEMHAYARELPRIVQWADLASIIDETMTRAINTQVRATDLLTLAQTKAEQLMARTAAL